MGLNQTSSEASNGFFRVVYERKSVRRYKPYDIPIEDIGKMLDAARLAPSANNTQPWRFIVVTDEETKQLLARPRSQSFIDKANAIIVVLAKEYQSCCGKGTWITRDPIIATEHLVLAATALGYGACWIAMYESRQEEFIEEVKDRLDIPDGVEIICLVAIGKSDDSSKQAPKLSVDEIAFLNSYGKPLR